MANFSHLPLQQAIFEALTNDATLMNLIEAVYDRPPQGSEFPYITLGESIGSDWSTKTTTGIEHLFSLHVWSREGGRQQTAEIMERVYSLLHQGSITVIGQAFVLCRFASSSIALESDGWTYHGIIRFRILLQSN